MPILGWAIVAIFAGVITTLIIKKNRELANEYKLGKSEKVKV